MLLLAPLLPQPVKFPGWKMHTRTCKQYTFRSYNTSTFSAVRFDENPFTCLCNKEDEKAEGFQIWYFYWSLSSDIMAVKGFIRQLLFKVSVLFWSSIFHSWLTFAKRVRNAPECIVNLIIKESETAWNDCYNIIKTDKWFNSPSHFFIFFHRLTVVL